MRTIVTFLKQNQIPFLGILCGLILGYLYWYYIACYAGTFPLSTECWVNCTYGAITGGFIACLVKELKVEN